MSNELASLIPSGNLPTYNRLASSRKHDNKHELGTIAHTFYFRDFFQVDSAGVFSAHRRPNSLSSKSIFRVIGNNN